MINHKFSIKNIIVIICPDKNRLTIALNIYVEELNKKEEND